NEVVDVLQALGLIMGLIDAILGLTIFAMGKILLLQKPGRPMMVISACFGGPMLSIGLSGTYVTTKTGVPCKISVEQTLFVSLVSLSITLSSALIYLPRNEY
ncbi:3056_t:CDS:2, partial [Scutellospora calospora]